MSISFEPEAGACASSEDVFVAKAHDAKDDQKFCGSCYAKENGPKGYGYQGVMQPTSKTTKERENKLKEKPKSREQEVEERRNRTV